ncbi:MAG: hypothetical protein M3159_01615 [Actinomycetota bacterium]|nr:hypothetical protein [Actinomycetota bacterium]
MTRWRAGATWLALLLLVMVALHAAGNGALRTPGLTSASGWPEWLRRTDTVVVAFAIVRLVALVAAWYTLVVSTLTAAARVCGAGALITVADRLTVPVLRRVLAVTLSAGVATGALGAFAGGAGAQPADPQPTGTQSTVVMHRLPEGDAPEPPSPVPPAVANPAVANPAVANPPVANPPGEWRVAPGQCFWTIAADVLHTTWGRAPSDAEIVPYWQRLIAANRAVLSDRGNPDLIFPGQVFTVPPP